MKLPMQVILIVGFFLAGVVGFIVAYNYTFGPPVPDAKRRAVKPGMEAKAVRALLGPPTYVSSYSNNAAMGVTGTNWASEWTYERKRPWQTTWVYVLFTNDSVARVGGDSLP